MPVKHNEYENIFSQICTQLCAASGQNLQGIRPLIRQEKDDIIVTINNQNLNTLYLTTS